jgi:hypothetical protein
LCCFFFRPIAWLVKASSAKKKVKNGSRWAGTDSGMRIVVLLLSLLIAAMGTAPVLAHEGLLQIALLSLGKSSYS